MNYAAERRNSHDIWSFERQDIQRGLLKTKTLNQAWQEHEQRLRDIALREATPSTSKEPSS